MKSVLSEFLRILVSHLDPFLAKGNDSLFFFFFTQTWHLPGKFHARPSSLGIAYLGLSNSERFVNPRWVAWWR